MGKRVLVTIALSLIVIGVVMITSNLFKQLTILRTWPIFLVIPLFLSGLAYFNSPDSKKPMIFFVTLFLQLMIFFFIWSLPLNYRWMERIWPFFLIIPGVSFLIQYFLIRDVRIVIFAGLFLLTGIISLFFSMSVFPLKLLMLIWPVFLVIGGIFIILAVFIKPKAKS